MEAGDWVGIAAIAGVIVAVVGFWLLLRRLASRSQRRAEVKRDLRRDRARLDAHHTARYAGSPEQFARGPLAWPLAAGAGFAECSGQAVDTLDDDDPADAASMLHQWWGITNRGDLIDQVWWLLVEGHRSGFEREREHWRSLDGPAAKQARAMAKQQVGDERLERPVRFDRVRRNERDIVEVDFLAWDLLRAIMLLRNGVAIGYIDERVAADTMLLVAERLQANYGSWEELGSHFERARWHWRATTAPEDAIAVQHDEHRERALLQPGQPRALVPWDARLSRSERLIVPAMALYGSGQASAIGERWEQELQQELGQHLAARG